MIESSDTESKKAHNIRILKNLFIIIVMNLRVLFERKSQCFLIYIIPISFVADMPKQARNSKLSKATFVIFRHLQ